jgi:hypothetical protein
MGKFEENWKEVFEGAEVPPADLIWTNIDRDLANAEGVTMKRRIVLYQRIAAASVLFALLAGSFGIYRWKENDGQLAQHKVLENKLRAIEKQKQIIIQDETNKGAKTATDKEGLASLNQSSKSGKINSSSSTKPGSIQSGTENISQSLKENRNESRGATKTNANLIFYSNESVLNDGQAVASQNENKLVEREITLAQGLPLLPVPGIQDEPVLTEIMRKLPAIPGAFMAHKERKIIHEQVWASATAATGSYIPNTNTNNFASSGQSTSGSSSSVGSSFSVGMLGGLRVAKRIVLQSGIQYMNQSINSTSYVSSSSPLTAAAKSIYSSAPVAINVSSPYTLNSANEFVSVPVQAGYLFIDRKIGLQLNSGVSSDFFIQNTLSDPSGLRQSYSQGTGQDSPYRAVNFSGLMSSEVSYKLGNRYRVSVVPGMRYSFNPVLKSNLNSSGNPLVWDVGFRFRYIFR